MPNKEQEPKLISITRGEFLLRLGLQEDSARVEIEKAIRRYNKLIYIRERLYQSESNGLHIDFLEQNGRIFFVPSTKKQVGFERRENAT